MHDLLDYWIHLHLIGSFCHDCHKFYIKIRIHISISGLHIWFRFRSIITCSICSYSLMANFALKPRRSINCIIYQQNALNNNGGFPELQEEIFLSKFRIILGQNNNPLISHSSNND